MRRIMPSIILLILTLIVSYIHSASIEKAPGYEYCDLKPALRLITYFKNGIDYTRVYQISMCINSTYGDVCADGINDYVALLFCQSETLYFNAASVTNFYDNRTISSYKSAYANFSCPLGAGTISSCYDNVTTVKDCSRGFGGFLVVECSHIISPKSLKRIKMPHKSTINANSRSSKSNKDLYNNNGDEHYYAIEIAKDQKSASKFAINKAGLAKKHR
ncbi:PREDICTED: uncharacterized protein LOC109583712 [Amphimedon queenslandica]|uniref:SRCR domain-containing protein n=1 Tax=Amphimedon queenslandica TaxID=400682 RepID=A0A1X7UEM1_AMPQE|nr:PREDICTED: uncharacterized protein LOC109583712 [Amphimedon queenslandica]XP_019854705.1 PREDICTED: uncharacterized protein LOC109583712 [Amphimedon queenslandica]|eukprot:XP_019854704.1 PREDICTED: uncharacterized protein LOC109583712 [Amphimedon queenslandica]